MKSISGVANSKITVGVLPKRRIFSFAMAGHQKVGG